MRQTLFLITLLSIVSFASAVNWAVLVAGSKGYWNYRHQADICHAYNTLRSKGLRPENIIVFLFDDVAHSPLNPFPGKLFNRPSYNQPGRDIYSSCIIDYKGADVTPANYIKVLKGDLAGMKGIGTGKVLQSTNRDRVFLNFASHGGFGVIEFPTSQYLITYQLLPTLDFMFKSNRYLEMVIYLESCESGSMFRALPTNSRIYATTASSPDHSASATYCHPDDVVSGKAIGACLGDEYSCSWLEDTDSKNMCVESLAQQFLLVQAKTTRSPVMEWGDLSLRNRPAGDFTGVCNLGENGDAASFLKKGEVEDMKVQTSSIHSIDSRDVKLFYLQNKYNNEPTQENLIELKKEESSREYFDSKIIQFAQVHGFNALQLAKLESPENVNFDCLNTTLESFEKHCEKLSDYALKHVKIMAHMCNLHGDGNVLSKSLEVLCEKSQKF